MKLTSAGIVALAGTGTLFSDLWIVFGWDSVNFLYSGLYGVVFWICAENNLYSTLMEAGKRLTVSK